MGVVFALAASANLSVLVLSLYRKRFNTAGAVTGTLVGLVSCVVLVALSPTVIGPTGLFQPQVTLPFPLSNPGIVSVPLAFLSAVKAGPCRYAKRGDVPQRTLSRRSARTAAEAGFCPVNRLRSTTV
ncbi:hypothetical protein OHA79_50330 (plasmid) [Streptomyces sp. NBC_00841]|uniref:sodium:solute symporter family transporter n=1 Tax=unclassified Streptomyces TaxID=2593676 RepID=UPI0022595903|nr:MULTISPECIES: hypothetical protein [unclassified Streptomyces]MCX4538528.1 hypothetical protein [Streptomyces sp. NBC_01669]WSA05646.1 hypothetical protein OHA79_50330 [Streptomyces sp. NBC_00841]